MKLGGKFMRRMIMIHGSASMELSGFPACGESLEFWNTVASYLAYWVIMCVLFG
jgi:hypothetical protein